MYSKWHVTRRSSSSRFFRLASRTLNLETLSQVCSGGGCQAHEMPELGRHALRWLGPELGFLHHIAKPEPPSHAVVHGFCCTSIPNSRSPALSRKTACDR